MSPHKRRMKILIVLRKMLDGKRYSIQQLQRDFEVTGRSAYRYIEEIQNAGFVLEKDFDGRWFIKA